MDVLIPLFVAIPLISAFLIVLLGKLVKGFHKVFAPLTLLALLLMALYVFSGLGQTSLTYTMGAWSTEGGIPIGIYLVLDGFSVIMLCIISLIGTIALIYSISYISKYTAESNYYALFCLIIAGMNGVVLSGDLFNIFVFLEIAVIASYALVAFGVGKTELEASFKYQVLGILAAMLILLAISLIYWKTKTLNIADVRVVFEAGYSKPFYLFVQVLLIAGFGLKAAIIPFHAWLPDAHSSAPSPISAMLSGVLIKAVGIYVLIRLFFNMFVFSYDIALVLTVLGAISMVVGSLLAIVQWDLKRLLAYSSISQIGYVVMAFGMGLLLLLRGNNEAAAILAIGGGIYHMINHAVFKGLLFLNAGSLEHRLETRDLKKMGGLSKAMPLTSTTSFMASMSISGIPPFNGFFSKLIIIIAAINGRFYLLATLAVLVSIITLGYFLKFQRFAFFNKTANKAVQKIKEVPFPMSFSMIFLAVLCLALSLLAIPSVRETVLGPAIDVLIQPELYSTTILGI
ncbi:MAG: proton-conducting transporter membrane subunit [Bacteroidota bacterium]|nr:proton-conducting transporter membrane subunit [Bacteroidota bacterium]